MINIYHTCYRRLRFSTTDRTCVPPLSSKSFTKPYDISDNRPHNRAVWLAADVLRTDADIRGAVRGVLRAAQHVHGDEARDRRPHLLAHHYTHHRDVFSAEVTIVAT